MKNQIKIYLTMFLFWITVPSMGQEVKEVLVKINQAYKVSDKLFMDVIYKAQEESVSSSPPDMQKGTIFKNKDYLYNKMENIETIVQDSLQVIVDHSKKILVLTFRSLNSYPSGIPIDKMEAAIKQCKRISPLNYPLVKGYELWMDEEGKEKISFTYYPDSYLIDQVIFFYKRIVLNGVEKKNLKLEMKYSYPKRPFKLVSTDVYVQRINGSFVRTDLCKDYQFIDYTLLTGKNSK